MERSVQEIEDRIRHAIKNIATPEQADEYITDIHAFSDINLYSSEYLNEEEIYFDFVNWKQSDSM